MENTKHVIKAFIDMCAIYKAFGDIFAEIGVREPQPQASEAFSKFGETHRNIEKEGLKMLSKVKPVFLRSIEYKIIEAFYVISDAE